MDGPALDWPFPHGPRLPSIYNRVVSALESASGVRLVHTAPVERGERITYESSATLGVLDTLACQGWLPLLESDPGVAMATATILRQLASVEKRAPGHPHLVRLSLVARRLIVLAGLGMDPRDTVGIGLFLHDGGGRLPSVRCLLPSNASALPNAGDSLRLQFVQDVDQFWSANPLATRPHNAEATDGILSLPKSLFGICRRCPCGPSGNSLQLHLGVGHLLFAPPWSPAGA